MQKKLIFLDIDGTIYDNSTGITNNTINSINMTRNNGHKVFICTGRPKCEVMEEIFQIDFDGFIFASGADIEIEGKKIYFSTIENSKVTSLLDDLQDRNLGILVQGDKKCFFNEMSEKILNKLMFVKFTNSELKRFNSPENNIYCSIEKLNLKEERITKIVIFSENIDELNKLKKDYENIYDTIIYTKKNSDVSNGELMQLGINKATGIQKVLDYFKASKENTICFGDSRNDLEMVKFCNIGVCMENGEEVLKEVADEICPSVLEDGVSKSFKKFGLI